VKLGDAVEVHQVLGGCAPGYGRLLWHWCSGYTFERREGREIFVRATEGIFKGCVTRWRDEHVRSA